MMAEDSKPADAPLRTLKWEYMPSYGEMNWNQLLEAVSEAQMAVRKVPSSVDPEKHIGHQMVTGINYNSLNRIVSAFVRAALAAAPVNASMGEDERCVHCGVSYAALNGPVPLPMMRERVEIDATSVGFTLKSDADTIREIEADKEARVVRALAPRPASELVAALREGMESAAVIAQNWKCALRPGSNYRLLGHADAARYIAEEIREAALAQPSGVAASLPTVGVKDEITPEMIKAFQAKYREFWKGSWPDYETSRELLAAAISAAKAGGDAFRDTLRSALTPIEGV